MVKQSSGFELSSNKRWQWAKQHKISCAGLMYWLMRWSQSTNMFHTGHGYYLDRWLAVDR